MHFLKTTIYHVQSRWLATLFIAFGGVAILSAMGTIGAWSYWLSQDSHQGSIRGQLSAFVDTTDPSQVESVLSQISALKSVQGARAIGVEEFNSYLKSHFPSLAEMVATVGDDVIPRLIEVELPAGLSQSDRNEVVADIQSLGLVSKVEDTQSRVSGAIESLRWLSFSGLGLASGLWLVLVIVCMSHYQNAVKGVEGELNLLRSFGATKLSLFMPWILEALLQALVTATVTLGALWFAKHHLLRGYNDFFGTVGYLPFHWSIQDLPATFAAASLLAFLAHILGSSTAFWRSRIN